jgi:hypothetical protein
LIENYYHLEYKDNVDTKETLEMLREAAVEIESSRQTMLKQRCRVDKE